MGDIRQSPTEEQEKRFEGIKVLGDVDIEEFSGLDSQLSEHERPYLIAGVNTEKGKKFILVTNYRVLSFGSPDVVLLGEKEEFRDIQMEGIRDMDVSSRKDFDIVTVETAGGDHIDLMAPEDTGVVITGMIRDLQERPSPEERLDRLSEQREKGNITEEEYDEKKEEILREM